MDITLYLKRIHYDGNLTPTLEVLSSLQETHLLRVPFENLAIHQHSKIDLANSYAKIVRQNKGGFCYELNGLFYQLLIRLGFKAKMVSARVFAQDHFGPEFDHMALIVTIGQDHYLVDVGFGEFAFHPLLIQPNLERKDPRGIFKMEIDKEHHWVVKKKNAEGDFTVQYVFSPEERQLEEFLPMCHYHQTSSNSHFTQKSICTLPTRDGRLTLTGNTFKITTKGMVSEKLLESEEEVQQVLKEFFNLNYSYSLRQAKK